MTGEALILAERERQIAVEGHAPRQDDQYTEGQLCAAAECYEAAGDVIAMGGEMRELPEATWPWSSGWWKPSEDPVRNLVKAGALYRAEADRYLRRNSAMTAMVCFGHAENCAAKIDALLARRPATTGVDGGGQ